MTPRTITWNEAASCYVDEANNTYSYDGTTWTPRIGNPKANQLQHQKAEDMAKKTKKREGFLKAGDVVKAEDILADDIYPDQVMALGALADPGAIIRPAHYVRGRQYEPWDAIADWGLDFFLGNAVKYISRAGRKEDAVQDIQKAIQYLHKKLELLGDSK